MFKVGRRIANGTLRWPLWVAAGSAWGGTYYYCNRVALLTLDDGEKDDIFGPVGRRWLTWLGLI